MVVKEVMEREGTMMARSRLQQTAIRAITIALYNSHVCSLIGSAHCSRHCHETSVGFYTENYFYTSSAGGAFVFESMCRRSGLCTLDFVGEETQACVSS